MKQEICELEYFSPSFDPCVALPPLDDSNGISFLSFTRSGYVKNRRPDQRFTAKMAVFSVGDGLTLGGLDQPDARRP